MNALARIAPSVRRSSRQAQSSTQCSTCMREPSTARFVEPQTPSDPNCSFLFTTEGASLDTGRRRPARAERGKRKRRLPRRTGRFPQLVDQRSRVNGLLSTGSPRGREVNLDVRRSAGRLKQSASDAHPSAHSASPNSQRRSQTWRAAGTGCPFSRREPVATTTKPTPIPWATSVKIVASFNAS